MVPFEARLLLLDAQQSLLRTNSIKTRAISRFSPLQCTIAKPRAARITAGAVPL
jgi:hypothetical protein